MVPSRSDIAHSRSDMAACGDYFVKYGVNCTDYDTSDDYTDFGITQIDEELGLAADCLTPCATWGRAIIIIVRVS